MVESIIKYEVFQRASPFRLSREERDHIAGHALDSVKQRATDLAVVIGTPDGRGFQEAASTGAREIAALSNLLGDIGWEREGRWENLKKLEGPEDRAHFGLGELFPVAQLRPWLEEWQRQDDEALNLFEEALTLMESAASSSASEREKEAIRKRVSDAQTKLGTGAILLARIEKWMASHGN